jgi:hypothetical protein
MLVKIVLSGLVCSGRLWDDAGQYRHGSLERSYRYCGAEFFHLNFLKLYISRKLPVVLSVHRPDALSLLMLHFITVQTTGLEASLGPRMSPQTGTGKPAQNLHKVS